MPLPKTPFLAKCTTLILGITLGLAAGMPLGRAMADGALTGLQTADDLAGLHAVGRLNIGDHAFCTATLIAPDLVLTAAHCLFDKETGARIDLTTVQFAAGFRNGRADAYRDLAQAVVHPDYIYSGADDLGRVAFDAALLRLSQPILSARITPIPAGRSALGIGDRVEVVSYAHDRAEVPSLQRACLVLDEAASVYVLSCNVDFGSSGSPVMGLVDGRMQVLSVIAAKAEVEGQGKVSLAMALEPVLSRLTAEMAAATPSPVQGVRVISGGNARLGAGNGAKFVKPKSP